MKKSILFFATAVICAVAFSSCEQQEIEKAVAKELNYCEVTVLGFYKNTDVHNFSITYENGYGENLGTYLVPQNTSLTISWEDYDYSGTYTETFNVGTASKLTIVIDGKKAEANY